MIKDIGGFHIIGGFKVVSHLPRLHFRKADFLKSTVYPYPDSSDFTSH